MIYKDDYTLPTEYYEQLTEEGLEGLPDLIRVLVNQAMQIERINYLQAKPYERNEDRQGYANGYKSKTVKTRVGPVTFDIPQVREGGFYHRSLEKGIRSERALMMTLAEMHACTGPQAHVNRAYPLARYLRSSKGCVALRLVPAKSAGQLNNWMRNWKSGAIDHWGK